MIRIRFAFWCCLLLAAGTCCSSSAELPAEELRTLLDEATEFFDQGNELAPTDSTAAQKAYEQAIVRYERIVQEGEVVNGRLYYNLGNAYFLSGDLGRSVLNYLRAAQYIPNDPNLHQNLDYVRRQRVDRIEEPQRRRVLKTLFFWHYDLSSGMRGVLFAVFFAGVWCAASLRLRVRRVWLTWLVAGLAVLTLALAASLGTDAYTARSEKTGVIIAHEVVARKGNGESYEPSFEEPLHAGTEFLLEQTRGEWKQIRLHDGRTCWVPGQAAELVVPE